MVIAEHPEKCSWWLNELESLGINTRDEGRLDNLKKASMLTVDIKQLFDNETDIFIFVGTRY
jgi:hypothetical protein